MNEKSSPIKTDPGKFNDTDACGADSGRSKGTGSGSIGGSAGGACSAVYANVDEVGKISAAAEKASNSSGRERRRLAKLNGRRMNPVV